MHVNCKIWAKNSQLFEKKCQKTSGGIFLTRTEMESLMF